MATDCMAPLGLQSARRCAHIGAELRFVGLHACVQHYYYLRNAAGTCLHVPINVHL